MQGIIIDISIDGLIWTGVHLRAGRLGSVRQRLKRAFKAINRSPIFESILEVPETSRCEVTYENTASQWADQNGCVCWCDLSVLGRGGGVGSRAAEGSAEWEYSCRPSSRYHAHGSFKICAHRVHTWQSGIRAHNGGACDIRAPRRGPASSCRCHRPRCSTAGLSCSRRSLPSGLWLVPALCLSVWVLLVPGRS